MPFAAVHAQQGGVPEITPAEAQAQAKAGRITLIDVRTPDEWRETGVAPGATPINLYHPGGAEGFVKEVVAKVGGKRDTPIAFICRSGNRSGQAQRLLAAQGFTNVVSVREGMSGSTAGPGWIRSGLPVERCKVC
ncbi:Rhodanese-like domain-containing protein [Aromatoleum petrolei]|nr:Rhodanese-like domain-containing protein [Aromatoleum petrolei]